MKTIWNFFNSVKLTVYLVLVMVVLTIYGSMVIYVHPEIFGDMDQSLFFHWLFGKGTQFPAQTWWLFLLVFIVVLFGINTFVCTVERLPVLIRKYRNPLGNLRDLEVGGDRGVTAQISQSSLEDALRRENYKIFSDGGRIYAEKNRWVPFLPYAVHIGVFIFLIGHLISGVSGYRHSGLYIFEGETAKSPGGNYELRLDKVSVETRPDGSLKNYGSYLTAIKDGRVIKTGMVTANTPMFVEGGAVYQREFGQDFRGVILQAAVKSSGFNGTIEIPKGMAYADIPGTPYRISVEHFVPDFAVDDQGQPFSQSDDLNNPALFITLLKDGKPQGSGWIFVREAEQVQDTFRASDVSIHVAGMDLKAYSSFDVNRDPSAIIALIASAIVMFGTLVTLYFRRERVWATLGKNGSAQVMCTDEKLQGKLI